MYQSFLDNISRNLYTKERENCGSDPIIEPTKYLNDQYHSITGLYSLSHKSFLTFELVLPWIKPVSEGESLFYQ
jgi:hypothetical protein